MYQTVCNKYTTCKKKVKIINKLTMDYTERVYVCVCVCTKIEINCTYKCGSTSKCKGPQTSY